MRIYKNLKLVEHLGSGIPRILKSYPKECFKFSTNFLRMSFPSTISADESKKSGGEIGGAITDLTEKQSVVFQITVKNNKIS